MAGSPSGDQRDLLGERTGSPWRDLPERYGDLAAAVRTDEIHRPRCSSCRHQLMVPAPLLLFSAEPAPLLLFSPSDEAAEDASEHAARLIQDLGYIGGLAGTLPCRRPSRGG